MAKLYFRYGSVGSAKTLNLLAVAHNYEQQNKKVLILKPALDNRFGLEVVRSRAGLEKKAHFLLEADTRLIDAHLEGLSCILVDEAQFLSEGVIEHFRSITLLKDIPVICYGLRTDFKSRLFEGARRLLELADSVEEVKNTCHFCNQKAVFNLKFVNGKAVIDGPSVELGAEEKYLAACARCYDAKTHAFSARS